jgi:hypothetical protein
MNKNENLLAEIRRQAIIRASEKRREEEVRQDARYTLDALQELTGLPRRELQAIAATVSAASNREEENFFSIKDQLLMVSAGLGLVCLFAWAGSRLIL